MSRVADEAEHRPVRPGIDGAGRRIAVVAGRFNEIVTERLVEGARACLAEHGVAAEHVEVHWVPGAWELPLATQALARTGRWDAIVAIGCVVRGETPHFEFVAGEAARGLSAVSLETGTPVAFGVLTTDTAQQARQRAGGRHGNKGWEAALAALEMAGLLAGLERS